MKRPKTPSSMTEALVAYIDATAEPARARLHTLRALIREEAPEAVERMAYGIPSWYLGGNLVHLAAYARHIGLYPGPAAIEAYAAELSGFKTSKGAIQLPHAAELPLELLRRIVRWRVEQVTRTSC